MQAIAKARFVRTSPRKARLVIDAIRSKRVDEALALLQFTPNYAARLIEKVVKSAAANAENNHHMDGENLKVAFATVDGGPMMKRLRYAPMGRSHRIVKRLSHITIALEETEPKPEKKSRRRETARAARGPKRAAKPVAEQQPDQAVAETPAAPEETRAEPEASAQTQASEQAPAESGAGTPEDKTPTPGGGEVDKPEGETDAKGGE